MKTRTDFADEWIDKQKDNDYTMNIKKHKYTKITTVEILKDQNRFSKEKGTYVSIDFKTLQDEHIRKKISDDLIDTLHTLRPIHKKDKVLIVGLGNAKISADSLGPAVADKIMVTNHLFALTQKQMNQSLKRVCVFTPKVMGQTGLESADLIKAVVDLFQPNLMIIVDALASSSILRINRVIQLSNTGIAPGSGVGNYRKEVSAKTMKTDVLSIGVATVVEAYKIIKELTKKISIPNEEAYSLILTPKEIDEDMEHLSTIIATSINKYIHENLDEL